MLRLFKYDAVNFNSGQTAFLGEASKIKVTREINGAHDLSFNHPACGEKAEMIKPNMIVVCEGQAYRIMRTSRQADAEMTVECSHVYNADAPKFHLQNVPDMIGVKPVQVIQRVFLNSKFTLFSDSELEELGMRRVDYDGFKIDFFSEDKTNPYDVMKTLIESCGKGEIYTDNYKIALVECIGKDRGLRLSLGKNLGGLTVEKDVSDLVTRLYPYGYSDAHIGSVNGGIQYIESPNAAVYGIRSGYADYSEYKSPQTILERALWEFDSENEKRIDVPDINISGDLTDLSKLAVSDSFEAVDLGDKISVSDGNERFFERVIKIEKYPFEPERTAVSIGRVKKDLFFYLNQMGTLSGRYKKISTSNGRVNARCISGNVNVDGINTNLNGDKEFTGAVSAPYITLAGISITEQDGELYINGRKILLEDTE